jgi:hypothetical protein
MTKPFDINDFEEIHNDGNFVLVNNSNRPLGVLDDGSYMFGNGHVIYFRTIESAENHFCPPGSRVRVMKRK